MTSLFQLVPQTGVRLDFLLDLHLLLREAVGELQPVLVCTPALHVVGVYGTVALLKPVAVGVQRCEQKLACRGPRNHYWHCGQRLHSLSAAVWFADF